jgi:hypothetical protein
MKLLTSYQYQIAFFENADYSIQKSFFDIRSCQTYRLYFPYYDYLFFEVTATYIGLYLFKKYSYLFYVSTVIGPRCQIHQRRYLLPFPRIPDGNIPHNYHSLHWRLHF